jgi:Helix-hairpin-helix domain
MDGDIPFRAYRHATVCEPLPELLLSVTHIGPRRARRLVDGLGEDWLALLDLDPERTFSTLRGMGRRRARIAARSWRRAREAHQALDPGATGDDHRVD